MHLYRRLARCACALSVVVMLAAASGRAEEILFEVNFENGLNAVGADPPAPRGAIAGGYEASAAGRDAPAGATISSAFPAQGANCLQLGHLIQWHIGKSDIVQGSLSFWIMPVALPPKDQPVEFIWGGDHAKPFKTFSMMIDDGGKVSANYYSWQNNQTWLKGVSSSTGLVNRQWNHVAFTWGRHGQRLFINNALAGSNPEMSMPISWLFDIRFGGMAAFVDGIRLSDNEQPPAPATSAAESAWKPTSPIQQDLLEVEQATAELLRAAPKGSDAYCRGLIFQFVAASAWMGALTEPPTPLGQDNVTWMKQALASTPPTVRRGEIPVPAFDAKKKITIADGRIYQEGRPTFLLGNYSPTPFDSEIGFSQCGALMPGPMYAMPGPDALGDRGAGMLESVRNATAANKVIDLLISLTVPGWVNQLDPHAAESGAGWFTYNVESAGVRALFRATADVVVPQLNGASANLIVNLANEPAYSGYSPATTSPAWRAWLMRKHGSIKALNEAWSTNHASFLEVNGPDAITAAPVGCGDPGGIDVPTDPAKLPQWYDWCLFNQQRYDLFFAEIRDNVRRHRPDTLFTIKWLSNFSGWWKSIGYALNPYGVTKLCDLGGCDAWTIYAGLDPNSNWGMWWDDFARTYDLLKSIAPDKPVSNSENHLLRGDDPTAPALKYGTYRDVIPWQHFYTAVWEQAIHGGAASEYWTYWESGKGFNLTERAKALDATSQAARDLRRYAVEVTAIANEPPQVAVLLSSAALAWSPKDHVEASVVAYKALNQLGVPVGYMLEEMLADGALDRYRLLVVPQAVNLSREMAGAIDDFAGRGGIVVITGDAPSADEYGKALALGRNAHHWKNIRPADKSESKAFDALRPDALSGDDAVVRELQLRLHRLMEEKELSAAVSIREDKDLPYGIEWRSVVVDETTVLNVCNFSSRPKRLTLAKQGESFGGVNLLSGADVSGTMELQPLEVALIRQAK